VDDISGIDILMMRISVVFVVFIVIVTSIGGVCNLCSVILDDLLGINVLEDATVIHGVVGSGVKLAWTL